jgi:hypothetical protein
MAVVQISRIQVRRGQKNAGSGIPQLASGELGWAVDARELFIGNGAVSEGAPAVGNTKVLTQYDNIFDLADTYTYRADDAWMDTGGPGGTPVTRSLQARLDDTVNGKAFGLTGETSQIATVKLQTAIDQLYLSDAIKGSIGSRVKLHLTAGEYIIDDTIYIPPYATIIGDGSDKTVIRSLTTNKPMFKTVNSTSTVGTPSSDATSTTLNQSTDVHIEGITLETTVINKVIVLDSCKDSTFKDVKVKGPWTTGDAADLGSVGIEMNSLNGTVETKHIKLLDCIIDGFEYGLSSDWDTNGNYIKDVEFINCAYGIAFGTNLLSLDLTANSGKETGPYENTLIHNTFKDINKHAIWIKFGTKNYLSNNMFTLCGNDGSAEHIPSVSVVKFEQPGNSSDHDTFSRTAVLSYDPTYWDGVAYLPEIEGPADVVFGETHILNTISRTGTDANGIIHQKRFRLPAEVDVASQRYDIHYQITSRNYSAYRSGILTINVNGKDKTTTLNDSHNYTGVQAYEDDISFNVLVQDADADTIDETIDVNIGSNMPSDDVSQIEFKVTLSKTNIDATGE